MEETKSSNETCLITNEELEKNHITLACKHKFNYEAIFYEIVAQKKHNHLETQKIKNYQIKCPYCRNVQNGLIIWKPPYEKIHKVNWPSSKWYKNNICRFVYKKGSKNNTKCEIKCYNNFCKKHSYNKCQAELRTGKRKGEICCAKSSNEFESKYYCKRHFKIIQKK